MKRTPRNYVSTFPAVCRNYVAYVLRQLRYVPLLTATEVLRLGTLRVEQQAMAQIAVISEANRYMSHEMQSLSHRVEELAREAPDPMDIDTEALTIVLRAVPAPPSFADTI